MRGKKSADSAIVSYRPYGHAPPDPISAWMYWPGSPIVQSSTHLRIADEEARREIETIRTLSDNWDGHGALKVSEEALESTLTFVSSPVLVDSKIGRPEVSPNPNGTMSVEWENSDGEAYVEFGNRVASGFVRRTNAPTLYMHGDVSEVIAGMPSLIRAYLADVAANVASPFTAVVYMDSADEPDSAGD